MTAQSDTMTNSPGEGWRSLGFATMALVLINVGVYLYQGLLGGVAWIDPSPDDQIHWGGNLAMLTLTGDWWRLGTSMFLHGGLLHLFMNMYMLVLIGPIAERRFGRGGMLLAYLAGGIAASYVSAMWLGSRTVGTGVFGQPVARLIVSVGASGALMALAGALLMTAWVRSAFAEDPEESDSSFGKALAQVIAINLGMGFVIAGVDNAAHIGGLLAGLAIGIVPELVQQSGNERLTVAARVGMPLLIAAAIAWITINGGARPELRELRSDYDEEQQAAKSAATEAAAAERKAATERAAAAERKATIERKRAQLPAPVSKEKASGQVIQFGGSGTSFALSADQKTAYAIDQYSNEISVIDLTRGVVERKIAGPQLPMKKPDGEKCMTPFCSAPADIALLRTKPLALVSSMQKDAVVFVDLVTGRMLKAVASGSKPGTIVMSADDKRAYVHNVYDQNISVIDVTRATVVHKFELPKDRVVWNGRWLPMWLSADGSRLFVIATNYSSQQMLTFDTVALTETNAEGLAYYTRDAALLTSKGQVMALAEDGLFLFDAASAEVKVTWGFCSHVTASSFAASSMGEEAAYVAVAEDTSSTVRVMNLQTLVTIGRYPVDGYLMKTRITSDGSRVFGITSSGSFITLDTKQRLQPHDDYDLLCGE